MGIREYARHRNISHAAVQDQIKKKLLTVENGGLAETKNGDRTRIWVVTLKADEIWDENVVVTNKNMHSKHPDADLMANKNEPNTTSGVPSYAQSRSIKEALSAKLTQLEYEKKSGSLCSVEDVAKAAKEMSLLTRNYLLNISGKLAPILAAETDIDKVHKLIDDEIHNALTNLSSGKIF